MTGKWSRFVLGFVALSLSLPLLSQPGGAPPAADEAVYCYARTSLASARDLCKGVKFEHTKVAQVFGSAEVRNPTIEVVVLKVESRNKMVTRIAISVVHARASPAVAQPFHVLRMGEKDFDSLVKLLLLDQ